jgi:hypothetical protein
MTSEDRVKLEIINSAEKMAKKIKQGKDIEITTCSSGIAIKEVEKKKI